ncbi:hypothetical protein M9H77_35885 [Catharanthus roseus]|uniref:Uncharacterized protein n=1 Tax=Catharanthus roseus TaxID=4058 RepID=A0ACB9ZQJ6_CATRO|nr:hypothetical protein M9H77_35885 [Catharanthus roseus]
MSRRLALCVASPPCYFLEGWVKRGPSARVAQGGLRRRLLSSISQDGNCSRFGRGLSKEMMGQGTKAITMGKVNFTYSLERNLDKKGCIGRREMRALARRMNDRVIHWYGSQWN